MDYNIKTDVKFGALETFDAGQMSREGTDKWWNQSLCQVNDCVVRLGVFEGEFHWHTRTGVENWSQIVTLLVS
jgi:hypothetical protein